MNGFEALAPLAADLKAKARERNEIVEKEEKAQREIARDTQAFLKAMKKSGVRAKAGNTVGTQEEPDIDFASAMRRSGVEPLGATPRAHAKKKAPAAIPHQTLADNARVLEESLSDECESTEFLESEDGLSFRRPEVGPDVPRDLRRGRWSVVGQIDLHGMFVEEARDAVVDFLKRARSTDRLCVRIIHGKGNGSPDRQSVLREKVRRWLRQREEVLAFAEARENDGGAGVTLVRLSPLKKS